MLYACMYAYILCLSCNVLCWTNRIREAREEDRRCQVRRRRRRSAPCPCRPLPHRSVTLLPPLTHVYNTNIHTFSTYIHTYIHTYTVHTCSTYIHIHIHTNIGDHSHEVTFTYIQIHKQTYIHTYIHTYTNI